MNTCASLFVDFLNAKDLSFGTRELGDESLVTFPYHGRNTIVVFGGDNGDHAQLITTVEAVPDEKYVDAVLACNQLNCTYRYVKFAVDKDNDVVVRADAILDESSAGEEAFELLVRNCQIIDEARPVIMKAIYGAN